MLFNPKNEKFEHLDKRSKEIMLKTVEFFENKGKTNPLFKNLHELCQRYEGLWSVEAEAYLLDNAAKFGMML